MMPDVAGSPVPVLLVDFVPLGAGHTRDLILLEWTTKDPKAAADDAGAARELFLIAFVPSDLRPYCRCTTL